MSRGGFSALIFSSKFISSWLWRPEVHGQGRQAVSVRRGLASGLADGRLLAGSSCGLCVRSVPASLPLESC